MPVEENLCAECKQPAELKCSACKLIWYCSKDHQKTHWKVHKSSCRAYEVIILLFLYLFILIFVNYFERSNVLTSLVDIW